MDKKNIGIIVDDSADLTKEIIEKYQIRVVTLNLHWPELENIAGENLFQKIRELEKRGNKSFAKTSQPSPKAFLDIFKEELKKAEKIICLTITSKHSGTYNSACQAKRFLGEQGNNVFVVDSENGIASFGLIALAAAKWVGKGVVAEEILKKLEDFIPQVKLAALLEDPSRLEASGRLSPTIANWIRKMQKLGIRPLIGLKEGKITAIGIKANAKDIPSALFDELENKTKKMRSEGKKIDVAIVHCDNEERAKRLEGMVKEKLKEAEIAFVNMVDDVLGSLLGADSVAVAWAPKE